MVLSCSKLSVLLRGITSKHYSDFKCLNCLYSFEKKNKRQPHKKLCQNKDFCNVVMPSEETKIFEFNHYQNLMKHNLLFT